MIHRYFNSKFLLSLHQKKWKVALNETDDFVDIVLECPFEGDEGCQGHAQRGPSYTLGASFVLLLILANICVAGKKLVCTSL